MHARCEHCAASDLESHPPGGPIDRVVVAVDPTPARIVQFLADHAAAAVARAALHALMARLQALMGRHAVDRRRWLIP
jgi:hypothetical protein